jgi:hypothetical protein
MSLNKINLLVYVTVMQCVYCEVEAEMVIWIYTSPL